MAVKRPTFSESWHRVAELTPRLRSVVQAYRQHYRGKLWYVLRDPTNNKFYRLDEAGYHFVALLDGRRTVDAAWKLSNEQLGDRAPTQGEAIQMLGQLYMSNLLEANLSPDAAGMFERYKKRVQREVGSYLKNLLFVRIPLFDPDRILDRWVGVVGWLFGPVGLTLWAVLMAFGLASLAGRGGDLLDQSAGILDPNNLFLLYISFAVIKAIHEFGHGFACKHFGQRDSGGGEVHTVGIMLLVFMPVPYVDATSSWSFRSKWHRAFVGAAGMYFELAVAAVAAMVWANTAEGQTLHAIAYNVIFVAGVSSILFNGNPLIRFDGYYILSDLLELPNLMQRSKEYVYYLVKKYVYGVKNPRNPAHSHRERFWLFAYAVTSFIYRIFLSVTILLFVADKLFFIGALLAIMAIVGWVIVPIGKFIHYLANHADLMRVRTRAVTISVGTIAAILLPLFVIPVPDHDRATGIVEPVRFEVVHTTEDGFIEHVLPSGTPVQPGGPPILVARNDELRTHRDQLVAELGFYRAQYHKAREESRAQAQAVLEQVRTVQQQLERIEQRLARLRIDPPVAGVWVSHELESVSGMYLPRGEPVGVVASLDELIVRATAGQSLGPRLFTEVGTGASVEMRVLGRPDVLIEGVITRLLPAGQRQLPSPALGYNAGGPVAVRETDESGREAAEPFFEVRVEPRFSTVAASGHASAPPLLAGQRVVVRFKLDDKPLMQQWWRSIRQVVQQRFQI